MPSNAQDICRKPHRFCPRGLCPVFLVRADTHPLAAGILNFLCLKKKIKDGVRSLAFSPFLFACFVLPIPSNKIDPRYIGSSVGGMSADTLADALIGSDSLP